MAYLDISEHILTQVQEEHWGFWHNSDKGFQSYVGILTVKNEICQKSPGVPAGG